MAEILFLSGTDFNIVNLSGSGLGFFGTGFGSSVSVNSYQDSTWITDGNGSSQGAQCDNVKWTHANSGSINGLDSVLLQDIPNYLSTLNIRFTHTSAVKTQNAKLRIYDRTNINNGPSGVTCKTAEIIHPSIIGVGELGSGDTFWITPCGSAVIMDLVASPGVSGESPNGIYTSVTQHDWYVAISASPDSIGSKTLFGAYVECEYL